VERFQTAGGTLFQNGVDGGTIRHLSHGEIVLVASDDDIRAYKVVAYMTQRG
jgi:hypothetical protein